MSLRVVVASTNPVKRRAALEAVRVSFGQDDLDVVAVEAQSGVPAQPFGDEETLKGARNRVEAARAAVPDADLWVAVEGGVVQREGGLEAMAWAVVEGRTPGPSPASEGTPGSERAPSPEDTPSSGGTSGRRSTPSSEGASGKERRGESRTATFPLPEEITALIRSGVELGEATDLVVGESGTKRRGGTVGPLTGGLIDRCSYYSHALILALIPFRNPHLTFAPGSDRDPQHS